MHNNKDSNLTLCLLARQTSYSIPFLSFMKKMKCLANLKKRHTKTMLVSL